jgi:branched-chain amino acid transport system substrate-binding protein
MLKTRKFAALAAVGALVLAACGDGDETTTDTAAPVVTDAPDDDTDAPDETDAPDATDAPDDDTDAGGAVFTVDTDACEDPDAATAEIEGSLKIGTSVPLSGGPAVLFAPLAAGQRAYIDYYNDEFGGIDGQPIELIVKDDQYTPDITKTNVDALVFDDEVTLVSGIVGSAHNIAIQADLNAQCIPQLWAATGAPDWGNIDDYPWTTGLLVPYAIESRVWAEHVAAEVGAGATVGLFYVNNEFGQAYVEAFTELAAENDIEIVAEETIDVAFSGAPNAQMTNLVQAAPDAILSVPLGAQCIAFMTELGNAKAANQNFDPQVYLTATCANPLFFNATTNGGADGVFTSSNAKYVDDPAYADDEAVQTFVDAMGRFAPDTAVTDQSALAGWLAMELTVYLAVQAFENGDYSRAGIINAARNINFTPGLVRDGLVGEMNAQDAFFAEGTQLVQWSDADKRFSSVGEVLDYNGSLGTYS